MSVTKILHFYEKFWENLHKTLSFLTFNIPEFYLSHGPHGGYFLFSI